jgi:16S rRNA (uracil1498-N3)-methyltransferase
MRRFWIPSEQIRQDRATLCGEEAHHLIRVLRGKPGQHILLIDGTGTEAEAEIQEVMRDRVTLAILGRSQAAANRMRIVVAQALLKDVYMEDLIRRWVELGMDECLPFVSERSVPILDAERSRKRLRRWEMVAREAMKQSGNTIQPVLHEPAGLSELFTSLDPCGTRILFWEKASRPLSRDIFQAGEWPSIPEICVAFGPEGGFTDNEVNAFRQNGFFTVSLGPRILRAVTAGVVGCALVQFLAEEALGCEPTPNCRDTIRYQSADQ